MSVANLDIFYNNILIKINYLFKNKVNAENIWLASYSIV